MQQRPQETAAHDDLERIAKGTLSAANKITKGAMTSAFTL